MKLLPGIETQSVAEIKTFQEGKLRELLLYLQLRSPFYQRHFRKYDIKVDGIHYLEDLAKIPCTTKDDLQNHNWDFLCVPRSKIAEYTSTSGTLGRPVTIALTDNDLERLAYNECISFACAEGSSSDIYQLMLTLDRQFMAGIAYYAGIRKLGAGIVRVGPGVPAMQWDAIERYQPTTLVAVPSFIVKLIEYATAQNLDINKSSVRKAICIGEGLRTPSFDLNIMGKRIREYWNIDLFGTYASTEMQTAFTECRLGNGGHHHPELIIVELLKDDGSPAAGHEAGEVTITTLGVEGMPLLRYKTGDMAVAYPDACPCGRTTMRLGPVLGRKQQMIKLKGTTIYPQGIFDLLHEVALVRDYAVEVSTGALGTDELTIHLLVDEDGRDDVQKRLASVFQSKLRVMPEIVFTTATALESLQGIRTERKIRRFVDRR